VGTGDAPLDGVLVADFSRVLAGPLATMTLGDLGADVIKVEHPDGDDTRQWGPPWSEVTGEATYTLAANRNKRSVVLDLADPADLAAAQRLAARADVVVHNFRPGTAARFGLDHASVARANPRVVTCAISGFGSDGPGASLPGYDLLVQAMAGWMAVTGPADGPPTKAGFALADVLTGQQAVAGILAALRAAERDGIGQAVEVALFDTALAGLVNVGTAWANAGVDGRRAGNRHPSLAPYEPIAAADGTIVVAVGSERLWRRLCEVLDRDDLVDDPRFATNADRVANVEALVAALEATLGARPVAHWLEVLQAAGVPAGRVHGVADAFALADELERDVVVDHPDGTRTLASPLHLQRTPVVVRRPSPRLGEHTAEVRAWLAE
jgi:crotonobetainyl-CoA:carnitine CoA-transferase CaiB-like acyl-CoA transferase